MNCDCIRIVEGKLAEKFSEELGTMAEAKCSATSITYGTELKLAHKTTFKITADAPGYRKGKEMPVFASFCPFCGKATGMQAKSA